MRFHVIAPGYTQATAAFASCAFTTNATKFSRMMTSIGHRVDFYSGGPETDTPCESHFGSAADLDRVARSLRQRAIPGDFLCLFLGSDQAPLLDVARERGLIAVEPAVGYRGTCAPRRIFPSYAWMHVLYASEQGSVVHPPDADAVIPHQLIPEDHPLGDGDGDYAVFVGRDSWDKGLHVAEAVCARAGVRLLVVGDAQPKVWGEAVGRVGPARRAELLGGAFALLAPSLYVEPFGLVAIEAQACGTPAIVTDWGAFAETVEPDLNGYRCRGIEQFAIALACAPQLDREQIRERAISRWSVDVLRFEFERYFAQLAVPDEVVAA